MAHFNLIMKSAAKALVFTLIILISLGIIIAPTIAPRVFTPHLEAAGIAACFARGAIVPRIWDTNPLYLLIEFIVALISTKCFIVKNCELPVLFIQARTNDSLIGLSQTPLSESFPTTLVLFAALVSFIGFEGLFFSAVSSEFANNNLGFFGRFHFFLWTLLESFNVGFVDVMRAVAGMLRGFVGPAEDQLLNLEEARPVGDSSVRDRPVGDCPIEDRSVKEPEASPPPPYISALPSIAHQDPITQYTIAANDDVLQIREVCKLV
jgi:hypothetical protein